MFTFYNSRNIIRRQDLRFSRRWRFKSRSSGWRWRQHGPPKRWYATVTLYAITTQKTSNIRKQFVNICNPYIRSRLHSSWTHLITPSWNFVEARWRSLFRSTSLGKRCTSYIAPSVSRKRAADRWTFRNFLPRSSLFMIGKAQKSHGRDLNWILCSAWKKWIGGTPSEHPPYSPDLARPMRFLGFSNHEKGAPRQEISKCSTVCSTFSRSTWSVVRSASLAKGGTYKKRPSLHLHKFRLGVIKRVHELFKRKFYNSVYILYSDWGIWNNVCISFSS
jgi:hypothetical protein